MSESESATPRAAFGAMLCHYRTRAGLSPEQLGPKVYLSGSMIRKIESGDRGPTDELVTALEAIPELHTEGALMALYAALGDHLKNGQPHQPSWFAGWPEREAGAVRLRSFSLIVIDGLFQTEDYMRAILATKVGASREWIDETVAGRLKRQAVLDRENPPELWGLLDEAALERPVGSPGVMARQVKQLGDLARRPNIVLQVIPVETGAHEGLRGGPFIVAEFSDGTLAGYQDAASSGQVLEREDAADLSRLWETARTEALPRAASLQLIERWESQWNTRT